MPEYIPLMFAIEALYPPMAVLSNQLRDFYVNLADPCRFTEFRQLGDKQGARLAEGANRHLTIGLDRIIYRDDHTRNMFTTFTEDLDRILHTLRAIFHIPVLLHSKISIRMLMPYQGPGTTVEFFQKNLMNDAAANFSHFDRPVSGVGLRLVFPPSQERHSTFHLRIEPYFRDLKMFYLENNAQFFDPIVDFSDARKYMDSAYNFVKEQGGPFVLSLSPPE